MKIALPQARPRSSKRWNSEAGQGTLEYILILIVSLLLILGILYQFSSAFRTYVVGYFGEYVACLLEVGDLPGVGSECAVPAFDLKGGKKYARTGPTNGSSSNSSSSSSSSTSSSSSSSAAGGSGSSKNGSSSSSSGGGGQAPETIAAGGSSRVLGGSSGRQRSSVAGTLTGGSGERGTQDDVLGISPTSTNVGRYSGNDRSRANDMSWGYYETSDEKEKKENEKPSLAASTSNNVQNNKLKAKSVKFETSRKSASVEAEQGDGFSFGAMFRILLIILMILAIIVFFGGQILQIAKSGDE